MKYLLIISTIVFLAIGCGPRKMAEISQPFPQKWQHQDGVEFSFVVDDTTNRYNVILQVSHQEGFGFQNLYTKLVTTFPDGNAVEDVVSLDVRKKSGMTQGDCNGNTCMVPFLIREASYFDQLGQHSITLYQHSRLDTLSGLVKGNLIIEQKKLKEG